MRQVFSACLKSAVVIPVDGTDRFVVEVDVEPRQQFCKHHVAFFYDFNNTKKYYLREGESSNETCNLKSLVLKVQENADRLEKLNPWYKIVTDGWAA